MEEGSPLHRKRPVHGVIQEPFTPTIVFVTACTKGRRPWLATPECHRILREVWFEAAAWKVGRYVVMPDHVHLFAAPDGDKSLEVWMRYWKRLFSQRVDSEGQWQDSHWDTRMRISRHYEEKWHYVQDNPVRQGLVDEREAWPYRGEIHEISW